MHKLLAQNNKSHFSQSNAVHTARTDTYELGPFIIHCLKWPTPLTHAPKNEGHSSSGQSFIISWWTLPTTATPLTTCVQNL